MKEYHYPLSVIIPIHRADLNIERCIDSLLANDKLDLQIIVAANSDSKAELNKINRKIASLYTADSGIILLNVFKAGKSNAINEALQCVQNEIVLIGDADTFFYRKGLNRCLSAILQDSSIVALTGNVDVCPGGFLTVVQRFEYRRVFRVFRPICNCFNGNLMLPGCAGFFRTRSLFEIGLYDPYTVGEDFEITLRLHDYYIRHKKEYKIIYINIELAKTDAPLTLQSLIKQRGRWFRGFLEVTAKYRKILFHPIKYWKIYIPFALFVIVEKWATFLKWFLIFISVGICVCCGVFALQGILAYLCLFGMLEILFNSAVMNKLKISNKKFFGVLLIVVLTLCLMGIRFLIKDTNVVHSLTKRKRENKW